MDKTQAHKANPSFSARLAALQAAHQVTSDATRERAVAGLHARGTVHLPPERPNTVSWREFNEFSNWPNWSNKPAEWGEWSKSYYRYPERMPEPA